MKTIETYFINFTEGEQKYRFILSSGKYDASIQEYRSSLSPEEEEILSKFKVTSRQNDFIAGRVLAKNSISIIEKKLSTNEINILHGVWGFPVLDTKELSNMWISIAHTKEYAAAILSEAVTHPIGVDIEEITSKNEDSLKYFLSRYDLDLSLEEKHVYWASKEAVSKALRTGFTIPEEIFEISEITLTDQLYIIKFKHLQRLQAIAWIQDNVVTSIAYPTELKFDSIQKHNFNNN
jgi:phosphopantetheinyl transferase